MLQHTDILDNCALPTLLQQFLFQHDCAPAHKASYIKTWFGGLHDSLDPNTFLQTCFKILWTAFQEEWGIL